MHNNKKVLTMNILVVDDSSFSRIVIKKIINKVFKECNISEAGTVDEAIKLVEVNQFDYATIDYNMPERKGSELAEYFIEHQPSTKLAFISANDQEVVKERAATSKNIPFFVKPNFASDLTKFLSQ